MYSISTIADIIKAGRQGGSDDRMVEHILLDSRKLLFPDSSLFFALKGTRRKGELFIEELYEKGVRCFVVDKGFGDTARFAGAAFLIVEDILAALQELAAFHRRQFTIPVIGITGSNGKTIVKEWLYQLLQPDYSISRSPRSYNSQIGVPLSIWPMTASHTLGIFEAGISEPGEMENLAKMIRPTLGILTNIGEAHSEGFLNNRQKTAEKLLLFRDCEGLIYDADDLMIRESVAVEKKDTCRYFSYSRKIPADLRITGIHKMKDGCLLNGVWNEATLSCTIPFTDDAAVANAISCWAVLLYLAVDPVVIAERMLQLRPVAMRLELKQGANNCSLINDSYSADINSLTIALDFLLQQKQHEQHTLILSDILQSGRNPEDLYNDIAAILEQKQISRLIGVGPMISKYQFSFSRIPNRSFFLSVDEFRNRFHSLSFHNETILLKGARAFEFEQISQLLEEKRHQTVLEINLNAITHNVKQYQEQLGPGVRLMAMVKAFSYGSGGFEIANVLQFHKVDYLAVAYADEGVALRKAGITLPLMVMNAEEGTFDVLVQYDLEPELYSFGILSGFERYLQQHGILYYPVHIKLDTGMRRLGFEEKDIPALCERLRFTATFKVQTVFSHLAGSDSALHDAFTQQQADSFLKGCIALQDVLTYPFLRHIANTAAIERHPDLQLDMVRLGIGLYGVDSNPAMQHKLKTVTTLKTTISQIKNVKAGESIGYSRAGTAVADTVIATVRIGYADGYPRALSNGVGKMLVNGMRVPVVGNVCMDMTMLDITGVTAKEGDEVEIFGAALPVVEIANQAQTITYEILTGISQRVKRIYFEE